MANVDEILNAPIFEQAQFNRGRELSSVSSGELPVAYANTDNEVESAGVIDYRIKQLSYSSMTTLHKCPRKYQLYKLNSEREDDDINEKITFGYGHAVGAGIQWILEGKSLEQTFFDMFVAWPENILISDDKKRKSLWEALIAIEQFSMMVSVGYFDDYELVYVSGKPATELSFCITFPDQFRFRGFVDAVLRHKVTGKIYVLETKTTGFVVNPAQYKNSAQALGYSVVLDVLFPELSSYEVFYLVYHSKDREYTPLTFPKNYLQRAKWIQDLLLDIEVIKMYEELGDYPMHGESCYDFFKECKYMSVCGMPTSRVTKKFNPAKDMDTFDYQIHLTMEDLIASQLKKSNVAKADRISEVMDILGD